MENRSENTQTRRSDIKPPSQSVPKTRLQVWFFRICSCILVWTCLIQLFVAGELWHFRIFTSLNSQISRFSRPVESVQLLPPQRNYTSNGILRVSCNGGLNQMRAAICDMVTVARLLNLTLVVPELDKKSFWADPSDFEDIFDIKHFVDSLRDEVQILRRLPKRYSKKYGYQKFEMQPVSWSNDKYYLQQVLPRFRKHKVIHFGKSDTRLANNGLSLDIQRLRCRVNFQGLKFTPQIEALGSKLVRILQQRGSFVAAGEIYGGARRLGLLKESFPRMVKKEMLLDSADLQLIQNYSSQMAALDFIVSVASNTFIPTYYGNMAKVVEGHRRYFGFKKTILLNRKKLVELLDLHSNKTLSWDQFTVAVKESHQGRRMGEPTHRKVISDRPKEEDYFYANPQECISENGI